jgi:hypothetical protein
MLAAFRPRLGWVLVVLAAAGLSGCGMGSLSSGWFGSTAEGDTSPALSSDTMLTAAKLDGEGASATASLGTQCPQFVVWPNDQLLTVYADGRDGDSLAVMHRGEITQTARECSIQPGLVTVKFGFSGRVLLGPKGSPGAIALPISVFVTDANREKIQTEPVAVQTEITTDKPIGYFSAVRTVSFPIPEGARPADYKLFVAFDKGPAA